MKAAAKSKQVDLPLVDLRPQGSVTPIRTPGPDIERVWVNSRTSIARVLHYQRTGLGSGPSLCGASPTVCDRIEGSGRVCEVCRVEASKLRAVVVR
jgi:hypothetical protein